jgi:hypothetical protein
MFGSAWAQQNKYSGSLSHLKNIMKRSNKNVLLALVALTLSGFLSSCATVFGGRVTVHQKQKHLPGAPTRQVRVGALIADILLFPLVSVPVDFTTGAIYKPKQPVAQQSPEKQPVVAGKVARK